VAGAARLALLVTRAIPPPVWALLLLFVVFPGPLPGALALGIYNFGILGRLMAEVVENLDARPEESLRASGAPALSAFFYATVPQVGAGGLGRLLEQQRTAFNYPGMLATVLALIAVSITVDLVSASARRSLR
jgi:phosphonate transport system permease protein